MAKKFDVSIARKTTLKKETQTANKPVAEHSRFYREFFDFETGKPIAFDRITKRIKKRFQEMDRLSVFTMLDLYFVHQNWNTFYNRTDSFKNYINSELNITREYAYGILKAVGLLEEYFSKKRKMCNTGITHFIEDIAEAASNIGIKKMTTISRIKDDKIKYNLLDRLIDGETISTNDIQSTVKNIKTQSNKSASILKMEGSTVFLNGTKILTLYIKEKNVISKIMKSLERILQNN